MKNEDIDLNNLTSDEILEMYFDILDTDNVSEDEAFLAGCCCSNGRESATHGFMDYRDGCRSWCGRARCTGWGNFSYNGRTYHCHWSC